MSKVKGSRQLSLGLLEMAARSANMSLFGMMPDRDRDKLDAARGLKKLTEKPRKKAKR